MKYFILTLITLQSFASLSQSDSLTTTNRLINPFFSYDGHNSFIQGRPVAVAGLRLGVSVNYKTRIGFGGYIIRQVKLNEQIKNGQVNEVLFSYNYANFFYDRVLFRNLRWEIYAPIAFGVGKAKIQEVGLVNKITVENKSRPTQVVTANLVTEYKIRPWIGVYVGGGYRYLITDQPKAKELMNAPFYSYGVFLYFEYCKNFLFNKEKNRKLMSDFTEACEQKKTVRENKRDLRKK